MLLRGTVSYVQAQGRRTSQEDYLVHVPFTNSRGERGHLIGVMDGHGGTAVAKYCAETIPTLFDHNAESIEVEFRLMVGRLNAETAHPWSGSTLSLACVNESLNIVTTAVLGDSPIIVVDDKGTAHWSEEHNVRTNLRERKAAIMRGAIYQDGYIHVDERKSGLQMSRALGDRELSSILDRTPSLRSYRINSRSIVIVASDGLFSDAYADRSTEMTRDLLIAARKGGAESVLRWREEQGLEDNTSVIMWKPRRWCNLFS